MDSVNREVQEAHQKYEQKLSAATSKHKEQIELISKEKDEQISRIGDALNVSIKRLQQRPSRPQVITEIREIISPCTGRELYREDGEFLTREAARAERIITERDYYFQRYEEARIMLERLNNE